MWKTTTHKNNSIDNNILFESTKIFLRTFGEKENIFEKVLLCTLLSGWHISFSWENDFQV